jgi:DNA-binding transcriptional LysR family regulator
VQRPNGLEVFLAIVEHGSLRAAAAELGVQPPAISYQLKAFEAHVGFPVLTRTTRSIRLTEAGRALFLRAKPAMAELAAALDEARGVGGARRGKIRITLPQVAYELAVAGKLAAFRKAFPDVELELSLNEAFDDIVADGFHAGIRMGDQIQADMVATRLTPPMKEAFFAAPAYFAERGRPTRPEDLLQHDCIRYRFHRSKRIATWRFDGPAGIVNVEIKGGLIVNSTAAVLDAARKGLGIGWLFQPNIQHDLDTGMLESALDRHAIERPGFFLFYPKENARWEVLRVFAAFFKMQKPRGRGAS